MQESLQTSRRINTKISITRHTIIKLLKMKKEEKNLILTVEFSIEEAGVRAIAS